MPHCLESTYKTYVLPYKTYVLPYKTYVFCSCRWLHDNRFNFYSPRLSMKLNIPKCQCSLSLLTTVHVLFEVWFFALFYLHFWIINKKFSQQASFSCQFKSFYVTSYNISLLFYLHTLNGISNIIFIHYTYFN